MAKYLRKGNELMKVLFVCPTTPDNADGLLMFRKSQDLGLDAQLAPLESKKIAILETAKAFQADWVFYCGLPRDLDLILKLKAMSHLLIWFPDSLTKERLEQLLKLQKIPDIVVCAHKNIVDIVNQIKNNGQSAKAYQAIPNCVYMPHYFADNLYNVETKRQSYKWECCFVGNGRWGLDNTRERRLQAISQVFHTKIIGAGFGNTIPQDYSGAMTSYVYGHSKIVLDLWWKNIQYGNLDFSVRVFNALGCGALLLTPQVPELNVLFKNGEHLLTYDGQDMQDLITKIEFWLRPENEKMRIEIALAGQAEVLKNHTITERIKQYWTLMKGIVQ